PKGHPDAGTAADARGTVLLHLGPELLSPLERPGGHGRGGESRNAVAPAPVLTSDVDRDVHDHVPKFQVDQLDVSRGDEAVSVLARHDQVPPPRLECVEPTRRRPSSSWSNHATTPATVCSVGGSRSTPRRGYARSLERFPSSLPWDAASPPEGVDPLR